MNYCALSGRLTRDIELKQTQGGQHYIRFTVAVDRYNSKEKKNTADFINCIAWNDNAKNIARFFGKGSPILIIGNVKPSMFEKQDGTKVYQTDIIVDRWEFFGNSTQNNADNTQSNANGNGNNNTIDFEEILGDSDLPF